MTLLVYRLIAPTLPDLEEGIKASILGYDHPHLVSLGPSQKKLTFKHCVRHLISGRLKVFLSRLIHRSKTQVDHDGLYVVFFIHNISIRSDKHL